MKLFNSIEYKAPEGETWPDVRKRCIEFFSTLENNKKYLMFTHGGLMCSLTWTINLQKCLPTGSIIGMQLNQNTSEPEKLHFYWAHPTGNLF